MEMLKNAYVLSTGVPQAIINYLSEAEFAKVVEQNHAKFTARVVNYQLDYNPSITNLYKKIMKYHPGAIDEIETLNEAKETYNKFTERLKADDLLLLRMWK